MNRLLTIISIIVIVLLTTISTLQNHSQVVKQRLKPQGEIEYKALQEFLSRDYETVIETVTNHIEDHPNGGQLVGLRACARVMKGDFTEASQDADQAILLDPGRNCGWTYIARGLLELNCGAPRKALIEFDSASKLEANCALLFAKKAECEILINDIQSCEASLKKVFDLEKDNDLARIVQAELFLKEKKSEEALKLVREVLESRKAKDNVYAKLIELIALHDLQNDELNNEVSDLTSLADKKIASVSKSNSKYSKYDIARLNTAKGYGCLFSKKADEACAYFEKALNMMPDQAIALEGLLNALKSTGKLEESKKVSLRLKKLSGDRIVDND